MTGIPEFTARLIAGVIISVSLTDIDIPSICPYVPFIIASMVDACFIGSSCCGPTYRQLISKACIGIRYEYNAR